MSVFSRPYVTDPLQVATGIDLLGSGAQAVDANDAFGFRQASGKFKISDFVCNLRSDN